MTDVPKLGGFLEGDTMRFAIWAPTVARAEIILCADIGETTARIPMTRGDGGIFTATAPATLPRLYCVRLDGGRTYPDPYARSMPHGVHAFAEVREPGFAWTDASWRGLSVDDLVLHELHVGTATPEGTFDALIPYLDHYRELGVTAIELMPVAGFPGRWNWGYDGVALYAPAHQYGGPRGLERLVDAAHARGLGVILDVVYNHLGPDGNYLAAYTPRYFTSRHHTPWGKGLRLDGRQSERVRAFLTENAAMWIRDYHLDGLRLDAVDFLRDDSDPHILREIGESARAAAGDRQVVIIAEDDRNEARIVRPADDDGYGLDGLWAGDFHHALRRALTGDHEGHFGDFAGTLAEVARALQRGWIYEGQPAKSRDAPRGTPADEVAPPRLVHFLQNHDQIGNRARGDRLGPAIGAPAFRALTALLLLSPYTPLLFMGQEWNATTPFQFFTDHNSVLGKLVTEGRRREFAAFESFAGEVPDPQDPETFRRSRLDWSERERPEHAGVLALHRELLRLRATHPALRCRERGSFEVEAIGEKALRMERRGGGRRVEVIVNLGGKVRRRMGAGARVVLGSEEERFGGAGSARVVWGGVEMEGAGAVVLEG